MKNYGRFAVAFSVVLVAAAPARAQNTPPYSDASYYGAPAFHNGAPVYSAAAYQTPAYGTGAYDNQSSAACQCNAGEYGTGVNAAIGNGGVCSTGVCSTGGCTPGGCDVGALGGGTCAAGACGTGGYANSSCTDGTCGYGASDQGGCGYGAGGCGESTCRERYKQDYVQGATWPTQYIGPPRKSICSTFELMTQNGWRRQNLLGQFHFKPDSAELTNAGQLKVQWVLTQTPPTRRTVFVERSDSEELTAERIAAVQKWASGLGHVEGTPTVNDTSVADIGRPAAAIDAVFTGWAANQPAPVLPKLSGTSTSSSGSGSN